MGLFDIMRNDSCLCGSGKKYKKCCLPTLEMLTRRFNNQDRWYWLDRGLAYCLAMVCGLPRQRGDEMPPAVGEIEEALDYISERVYIDADEDDISHEGYAELMTLLGKAIGEGEDLRHLLFSGGVLDDFAAEVERELGEDEEPGKEEFEEVYNSVVDRILPRLVNPEMTAGLCREVINALRRRPCGKEERAAFIFAIFICLLYPGVNPVWELVFNLSVQVGMKDWDEEEEDGEAEIDLPDPSWPIAEAYVPDREAMYISGFGCAGFVRRQPDDLWAITFFEISLLEGGIRYAFNKTGLEEKQLQELLGSLKSNMPPWRTGSVETASIMIRYAYELFKEKYEYCVEDVEPYLEAVPCPKGGKKQWQEHLVKTEKLFSLELLNIIKECEIPEDLPEGKEVVVLTAVSYAVWEPERIAALLAGREPELIVKRDQRKNRWNIFLTREYPKGCESTRAKEGERQVMASAVLTRSSLTVEAPTLSRAGVMCYRLRELCGGMLTFTGVTWKSAASLIKETAKKSGRIKRVIKSAGIKA